MPVTTRSQKKAAAVKAAELRLATPLTVDEYVGHLRSGLSFYSWYGAYPLASVLEKTLGRKIVKNKSLNVTLRELSTERRWVATTPLIMAVQQKGDASALIREMVKVHGCDPNFKNSHGMSPLYYAICMGNKDHVKTLVECGAVVARERHYSPVGGPNLDGGWEDAPVDVWYAQLTA
jgi:hypothetical protein